MSKDQKIYKTFCPMPKMNSGMLTLEDLEQITEIVRRYEVPMIKVTGAQRLSYHGITPEKMAALKKELHIPETLPHKRNKVHYVQACPGKTWCKWGTKTTEEMTKAIENLELDGPLPNKVKVGISGCQLCCCESWMRDIGLLAEKRGWRLTFGGNAGNRARIGDLVARGLSDDEALELIKKVLNYYISKAQFTTRSARFMERFGIETLKKDLGIA
ncbi:MAG: nitrite reductase [Desulfobulbus sp.]|nr:MAG: nitrite reductase [Desulfobulbus sp.]RUM37433.1 MAG: nitrite reductase [Desulfobulbus sp.]RUM39385.1 MAG: nitrite reductase [Desulfobulbus sp.]